MSYSSRVYRQRNPRTNEESQKEGHSGNKSQQESPERGNPVVQTKMNVNKPGDPYEKEADSVAAEVTNKKPDKDIQKKGNPNIQRLSSSAEDEKLGTNDARMKRDKDIQTKGAKEEDPDKKKKVQKKDDTDPDKEKKNKTNPKPDDPKKKEEDKTKKTGTVMKKEDGSGGSASPQLSSKIESTAGKGHSLQPDTLNEMNSSFNYDFDQVRIHENDESKQMNDELNAQAFTHGKDIYFNQGKFDPGSKEGKNLLAHELTHVVQQNKD
jgi:hypothetical protein